MIFWLRERYSPRAGSGIAEGSRRKRQGNCGDEKSDAAGVLMPLARVPPCVEVGEAKYGQATTTPMRQAPLHPLSAQDPDAAITGQRYVLPSPQGNIRGTEGPRNAVATAGLAGGQK
ncbi:hypothetical protein KCP75_00170 [Salmonella enterica subsp. enterica]|nr:hypothetical protein KCP75_00170 [Salmonella enterica subsp. enterica]